MAAMSGHDTRAGRFFGWVADHPRRIIAIALVCVIVPGLFLPRLRIDSSPEAFLSADDPAVVYREAVRDVFGLSDPVVILIVRQGPEGVFNPDTLGRLKRLTEQVMRVEGVDAERVLSIATQDKIIGTAEGIEIEPFFDDPPSTQAACEAIRAAVMDYDVYLGKLVSRDGQALLISAQLEPGAEAGAVYRRFLELVEAEKFDDEEVHVAGEGAISAHLGEYINADMRRLNLLCGVVITAVLIASYRTWRGVMMPTAVVGGAVAVTLGLMAAMDSPIYVITNALPVILIAIGVADGIHILGEYYERQAARPQASQRDLVVATMGVMWRPVTVTSLTDAAGFMALGAASTMPPMKAFGYFTAVGCTASWALSLLVLPAWLALLKPAGSGAWRRGGSGTAVDFAGRVMEVVGRIVTRYAGGIIAVSVAVTSAAAVGVMRIEVNDERIANFKPREPIYQADRAINRYLNGSNHLDIVFETDRPEGLFDPAKLKAMEAMEQHMLELPHVKGAISIVDYLKQINRAVHEGDRAAYVLPEDEATVAQYFVVQSAGGDPAAFSERIDYEYRRANIRVDLDSGLYSDQRHVVEAARRYIDEHFSRDTELTVNLAGRVNVDVNWIGQLASSHLFSVLLSLAAVWATLSVSLRSVRGGLLAILPVALSVLCVYAVMGYGGIWLSVGTSMFAAIAIGIGVNFAVHTLDRLESGRTSGATLEESLRRLFPSTGRAMLFSFAAVLLGFGLLVTSHVPPLVRFGALTTVSIGASFAASMTVLPALVKVLRGRSVAPVAAGALLLLLSSPTFAADDAPPPDPATLTGDQLAERINARDDGRMVSRNMTIELIDRRGDKRTRGTRTYRKDYDTHTSQVIFFQSPTNVKGTAFLNVDHADAGKEDDRWLYLPAVRRVRRVAAADRGQYFLGTDFTYEDINNQTKVNIHDYTRRNLGVQVMDGKSYVVMEATPIDEKVRKELGYGKVVSWIDPATWMQHRVEYFDAGGERLKTIEFRAIREVQGILTAHELRAENHKTGHTTRLLFAEVDYQTEIKDDLLTPRALEWGQ